MKFPSTILPLALFASLALACGGGDDGGGSGGDSSGVEASKAVTALNSGERADLCSWSEDIQGGAETTHECGDGVTVTVQSSSDCEASLASLSDCDITVEQYEACAIGLADAPCEFGGAACAPLFACLQ